MDGANNNEAKYSGAAASEFDAIGARNSTYPDNLKRTGNSVSWEIPRDTRDAPPPSYSEVELSDMNARRLNEPLVLCIVKVRTLSTSFIGSNNYMHTISLYVDKSGLKCMLCPLPAEHVLCYCNLRTFVPLSPYPTCSILMRPDH